MRVAIGIGVNCQTIRRGRLIPLTDLKAAGADISAESLFDGIVRAPWCERLGQWRRGAAFAAIRADWIARAAGMGGDMRVRLPDREIFGRGEGLDERGRLLLRLADGSLQAIAAGEVFPLTSAALAGIAAARACRLMADTELVFAPLGGIGEIGMNLSIYGVGDGRRRQWLIVDCGVSFAAEEHLPGVDLILPDIRFLIEERRNLVGLVLTHAHEDHMGALIDLWPRLNVPLYATPFAAALFEARRLSEPGAPKIPVNVVPLGGHLQLGPFTVDFINVAHSIPESNALAIRTPLGTVLHTGDWKIDPTPLVGAPTDQAKLTALGDEGVLALVGDSTNAVRDGRSPSEADVAKTLTELIRTAPARVAVTTFASHVGRIRAVADAARARRARSRGGRPRHGARRPGRARDRLSRRRAGFSRGARVTAICRPTRSWRFAPAARASRGRRSRASPRTSIRK